MTTFQTIRTIWNAQPNSEKLGCIAFVTMFPILAILIAVILP